MNRTILLILLGIIFFPSAVWSHGISCGGPSMTFDEPISHNFLLTSVAGTGQTWRELGSCSIPVNMSGGTGNAACVESDSNFAVDTALESFDFYVGCQQSVSLNFQAYFSNPSGFASLSLEAREPDTGWVEIQRWSTDIPGSQIVVDLSSFSKPGFAPLYVRWRFTSASSNLNSLVQIDNIRLNCVSLPQADVDLAIAGDRGPVPPGARRIYTANIQNYGSAVADLVTLAISLDRPSALIESINGIELTSSLSVTQLQSDFTNLFDGYSGSLQFKLKFNGNPSELQDSIILNGQLSSSTCDWRLNNNSRIVPITLNNLSSLPLTMLKREKQVQTFGKKLSAKNKAKACQFLKTSGSLLKNLKSAKWQSDFEAINPELMPIFSSQLNKFAKQSLSYSKKSGLCRKKLVNLRHALGQIKELWASEFRP